MNKKVIISITSAITENSVSDKLNTLFANKLLEKYLDAEIKKIDLNNSEFVNHTLSRKTIESFYEDTHSAKYRELLKAADVLVISVPVYNFGPSTLAKSFLESIGSQENGSYNYLSKLKVVTIVTQGAKFKDMPSVKLVDNLHETFDFIGVKNYYGLLFDGTLENPYNQMNQEQIFNSKIKEINKIIDKL